MPLLQYNTTEVPDTVTDEEILRAEEILLAELRRVGSYRIRLTSPFIQAGEIPDLVEFCRVSGIDLLIARVIVKGLKLFLGVTTPEYDAPPIFELTDAGKDLLEKGKLQVVLSI